MRVFKKLDQIILKFVRRHQRCWIAKTTLRKKKNAGGIRYVLWFQIYSNWNVWYWLKNRIIDQWNRVESPKMNLHLSGQLPYDKRGKNTQGGKDSVFNKQWWGSWTATHKRIRWGHFLTPRTKINSKGIKDWDVKLVKLLEENIGRMFFFFFLFFGSAGS